MTADLDRFSWLVTTGMRRVSAQPNFDAATTVRLIRRLDEFDAVRNRGAVESRYVPLAAQ